MNSNNILNLLSNVDYQIWLQYEKLFSEGHKKQALKELDVLIDNINNYSHEKRGGLVHYVCAQEDTILLSMMRCGDYRINYHPNFIGNIFFEPDKLLAIKPLLSFNFRVHVILPTLMKMYESDEIAATRWLAMHIFYFEYKLPNNLLEKYDLLFGDNTVDVV